MFDVVTIGTATHDVFLASPLFKVVRDPEHLERLGFPTGEAQCFALGGKVEVPSPVFTIGGGAANASVTFARQGFKTAALAKIGKDQNARDILSDLKKESVMTLPVFDSKAMTAYSVILLSPGGERTILNYRGASEDLRKNEIDFSRLKSRWAYIVPGRIRFDVIFSIVRHFKKEGIKIAMDFSKYYLQMGHKKLKPILNALDVIHVNQEEGAELTGYKYHETKKIFRKFDEWVPGLALMTDGANGAFISDGKMLYQFGTYKEKKLVDRTGAGDAFTSGFVAGLMSRQGTWGKRHETGNMRQETGNKRQGFSEEEITYAIRLASANATLVVEKIGATEGALRKGEFEKDKRWKNLEIAVTNI